MYDYYRIFIDVATLILVPLAGLLFKVLYTMRTNDMAHLNEKLVDIKEIAVRTEEKLDRHLSWHLDHVEK